MKPYYLKPNAQVRGDWDDPFKNLRLGYKPHVGPCRDPLTCGCQYTMDIRPLLKEAACRTNCK